MKNGVWKLRSSNIFSLKKIGLYFIPLLFVLTSCDHDSIDDMEYEHMEWKKSEWVKTKWVEAARDTLLSAYYSANFVEANDIADRIIVEKSDQYSEETQSVVALAYNLKGITEWKIRETFIDPADNLNHIEYLFSEKSYYEAWLNLYKNLSDSWWIAKNFYNIAAVDADIAKFLSKELPHKGIDHDTVSYFLNNALDFYKQTIRLRSNQNFWQEKAIKVATVYHSMAEMYINLWDHWSALMSYRAMKEELYPILWDDVKYLNKFVIWRMLADLILFSHESNDRSIIDQKIVNISLSYLMNFIDWYDDPKYLSSLYSLSLKENEWIFTSSNKDLLAFHYDNIIKATKKYSENVTESKEKFKNAFTLKKKNDMKKAKSDFESKVISWIALCVSLLSLLLYRRLSTNSNQADDKYLPYIEKITYRSIAVFADALSEFSEQILWLDSLISKLALALSIAIVLGQLTSILKWVKERKEDVNPLDDNVDIIIP